MSSTIHRAFCSYCKFTGKSTAWNIEEALLEYMQNHPVKQVSLTIVKGMESFLPDLETRLKTKIVKEELARQLEILRRVLPNPEVSEASKNEFKRDLLGTVGRALKIQPQDQEILDLLREAEQVL